MKNFTTREPKQYVDCQALLWIIHKAAELGRVKHVDTRRYVESEELVVGDLMRLERAAGIVRGTPVETLSEVHEWLFEKDALAYIKAKCRNRYWLWFLMEQLDTVTLPINTLALTRAHARAKAKIVDKRYGFNWTRPHELIYTLKGLPPGFVFQIWDEGKVLANRNAPFDGYGIILNPLLLDD